MRSIKSIKNSFGVSLGAAVLLGASASVFAAPPERLIVEFKDETQSASALAEFTTNNTHLRGVNVEHVRPMALRKHHVFKIAQSMDEQGVLDLISEIQQDPRVAHVERDRIAKTNFVPNDTRYNEQWHYFETTGGINAPAAWDKNTGAGVIVAVVDTGYVYHSDLDANVLPGYDFISDTFISADGDGRDPIADDPGDAYGNNECGSGIPPSDSSWHGTHVSGTVAAVTDNADGVAGVAFNAQILPVRVLGKCGGYTSDIADGVIWASGGSVAGVPNVVSPAQVVNLSLGGTGSCGNTMQSAINTAVANGTTVVVAAGNSADNAAGYFPASCDNILVVAANDRGGNRAWYSNYGAIVDVTAPGGDTTITSNGVLSTLNTGTQGPVAESYAFYQGTSMAAPHAAGVAALLYSADSAATPAQVMDAMINSARPLPGSCTGGCGAGIIDASAAIDAIGNTEPPASGRIEINGLAGAANSWTFESLGIPSGVSRLVVRTSGGTGDVILYVQQGAEPTAASFDCRSARRDINEERCIINSPTAGQWYVGVRGRLDFTGVNLVIAWQ